MNLDDQQLITYLANVIHVARADGVISPQEKASLEGVRTSTGAKKAIYNAAMKAAESPSYSTLGVGSFAAKVANLEDMFRVALSDGDLSLWEQQVIDAFGAAIGISPELVERLRRDVATELSGSAIALPCEKCGAALQDGARFCAICGASLQQTQMAVVVSYEIPSQGYAIEFAESTAAGFDDALGLAKNATEFRTCLKGKKNWYLACYAVDEFAAAAELADRLGSIRNRRVLFDGQEVAWDELFGFTWCARERKTAYRPQLYCFGKEDNRLNPWGCKNAGLEWTEWANWFSYGSWRATGPLKKTNIFVLDKGRIRHEVHTNIHRFRFCPHLLSPLLDAVIAALPEEVKVEKGGHWTYAEGYEERPGAIRIMEVETSDGFSMTREFWADGVRPRGLDALRAVLSSAFASAGVDVRLAEEILR
jgi:uncharacterized tellurite resistance protein B-like protein